MTRQRKMTGGNIYGYSPVPPQLLLTQAPLPARTQRRIDAKLARKAKRKGGAR